MELPDQITPVSIHTLVLTLDKQHSDIAGRFLRSLSNVLTGRSISAAETMLRQLDREAKTDEVPTLDQRNELDAKMLARNEEERIRSDQGFAANEPIELTLQRLVEARDYFFGECLTYAVRKFDEPMTYRDSINWMSQSARPVDEAALKAVSEATGLTVEDLRKLHQQGNRQRADQLILNRDKILDAISNFATETGRKDSFDELNPVTRHRIYTSAAKAYQRSLDRLAQAVLSGRSTELSLLAVLNKSKPAIVEFVENFEKRYEVQLREAQQERDVTLDDIREILHVPMQAPASKTPKVA